MVLAGVVLSAFSLRLAVSGVAPVLDRVRADVGLGPASTGVLAMLPSLGFALTGLLAAVAMRRVGLEALLTVACALAAVGTVARALVADVLPFLGFSLVIMIGLGIGNVALPPIIKKYFRDRIEVLTALYSMLLGVSTATAPLFAVPLADLAGWRVSIGSWAVISLAALVPWALTWRAVRREAATPDPTRRAPGRGAAAHGPHAASSAGTIPTAKAVPPGATAHPGEWVPPWRSRIGWGLVLMFVGTSANTFSMFTWLPAVMSSYGFDEHVAGLMLSYYAILGLPVSVLVPLLVRRLAHTTALGVVCALLYALGYAGLLTAPAGAVAGVPLAWLWLTIFGLGQASFPLALTLINARTRSTAGAGSLSGFGQGVGYLGGSAGPLIFGVLHGATDSWWPSFGYLWLMLGVLVCGVVLTGRPRFMEDRGTPRAARPVA